MKIFLDFDRTLYDLDTVLRLFQEKLEAEGISKEIYEKSRTYFAHGSGMKGGSYSPERHEKILRTLAPTASKQSFAKILRDIIADGEQFVFDGVREFLDNVSKHERIILTFGDAEFQSTKIKGAGLDRFVEQILVTAEDKWGVIEKIIEPDEGGVFVDDHKSYFSLPQKLPSIRSVHLSRSGSGDDCAKCFARYHTDTLSDIIDILQRE